MDISNMLEVQVKVEKDEYNVTSKNKMSSIMTTNIISTTSTTNTTTSTTTTTTTFAPISEEESNFYQLMFGNDIASVRHRRLHCTACDTHIGSAPSQAHNMFEHPMLHTLLCANCREFYGDGIFEQGDDSTDMFCRWCANGGNLYCCSYCSNTFCNKCIRRNFSSLVRRKIEAEEKWKCFVCNPGDLYSARAICWALLKHVQTVTRLLNFEKNMNSEEIKEKMDLDESQCCSRKSRRKNKRKRESDSEEEDETYKPDSDDELSMQIIPQQFKKFNSVDQPTYIVRNGTLMKRHSFTFVPGLVTSDQNAESFKQIETRSMSSPKSVVTKYGKSSTKQLSKNIISSPNINSNTASLTLKHNPSILEPTLYNMNNVNRTATPRVYRRMSMVNSATHQAMLPTSQSSSSRLSLPQIQNSYQSFQSPSNTMVSVFDPRSNYCYKGPQSKARESSTTSDPNIIELNSDSDDETRIGQRNTTIINKGSTIDVEYRSDNLQVVKQCKRSQKVVPVALVKTENCDNDVKEEQSLREMSSTVKKPSASFSEIMLPHSEEIDKLLGNVKERMHNFFILSDKDTEMDIETTAFEKIKQFYQNMRNTIFELACINDRTIREYNKWKRSRQQTTLSEENVSTPSKNIDIPLDMVCDNDSDAESDSEFKCRIIESTDLVKVTNIIENLFSKKNVKHCGVGNSALSSEDKAIQVYEIDLKNYEKCISYSLLTKANYNSKMNENISEPAAVLDNNLNKYEEQFMSYLRYQHGIETENMKKSVNLNKTSQYLTKPKENTLPYTLELSPNIDLPIISVDQSDNYDRRQNVKNCVNSAINGLNTGTISTQNTNVQLCETIQKTDIQKDL